MTNLLPNIPDAARYTVTETAKILEVSRQTINRHVEQCLLIPTINPRTKRKTFTGKAIKKHWTKNY